jgi:hypothetical protein
MRFLTSAQLANRIPAYKSVVALVPPSSALAQTRRGGEHVPRPAVLRLAFAVSDPYLSCVQRRGVISVEVLCFLRGCALALGGVRYAAVVALRCGICLLVVPPDCTP